MLKFSKIIIFLVLFICVSIFAFDTIIRDQDWQDSNTIIWTRWSNPPIFIESGPYKGMGVADLTQKHLFKLLPNYNHKVLSTNIPRVIALAKEKAHTCNVSWLDTPEWRKDFYFSKPFQIVPTNGIIIRDINRDAIGREVPVSFDELLGAKKLRLGVARFYGEGLDDILEKYNYKNNPKVSVASKSINPHLMLMSGRVDYILGYPMEVIFYQKTIPGYDGVAIPTKENTNYVEVVMGCSKTPWGKKVIDEINKILEQSEVVELYQKYMNDWLPVESLQYIDDKKLIPSKK